MMEFNFACEKCPRTFKLQEFYDKHKKVHDLKKQHKCDICGFVYGAAKGLEGHVKTHSDEEIAAAHQAASRCSAPKAVQTASPFGVDFHFLNPQGVLAQAKQQVSACKEEPLNREHLNGKAPASPAAGTGNYQIYDAVPEVSDAAAAVQNDSGFFMCSICNREFSGLNSLKKHIPIHTRKIQHKCDVCGYVFGKKEYLMDHMRKHTGEVSPICEVCGQTFNKSLKLKEHFKLHRNHGPNGSMSPYKCHICQAIFARPDILGNHLTVAHAETVYKCDICEATFGDVRGKNHHMYNEHQLDAFHQKCVWCPVCNQGFTRHYNLKVHMYKSHGKDYIENNFTPAELQALMKAPPSSPPLPQKLGPLSSKSGGVTCTMCGSKFVSKAKLVTHMVTHGVVPVPCPTCGDKFLSAAEQKTHMIAVHLKRPAAATAAKKPFRRPGPASRTNAPPEKRGSISLPTYLQLTRRTSTTAEQKPAIKKPKESSLAEIVRNLVAAAASKSSGAGEKQACNFCTKICSNQHELSSHLSNDHFGGLLTPSSLAAASEKCPSCPRAFSSKEQLSNHIKTVHRAKLLRRSLGLEADGHERRPRPGPKRARLSYYLAKETEGTIPWFHKKLPSFAVLSSSRIASLASQPSRPVVLCSNSSSAVNVSKRTLNNNYEENNNNNNNNNDEAMTSEALSFGSLKPRKKSECPVCGIILSPKTNVNVHLRTHSGVRPYECVLCLNRFRQKAHLMKHFRCTHNQKQPPHICLFCSLETATSNDLYRHITDQHQKETDELRPSLLAARSDAAEAAAKEAEAVTVVKSNKLTTDNLDDEMAEDESQDVRYDPITEDFMYEDFVISPCYVVLPFVSEEEIEAASHSIAEEEEGEEEEDGYVQNPQDYLDDEAPLTIDESIVDDEPELPRTPIKASDLQEEILRRQQKLDEYNAEDINGDNEGPGFYPAMADYSLPFSMANIWKKKTEELSNFNAIEHLALMQKIEQMQKYNGSVVYNGPPSPPSPAVSNGHHHITESPKKASAKPKGHQSTPSHAAKEKKFIGTAAVNQTPVADYEGQIKNDLWPLDCIKCNSLLGNLDNFNLHMNDHWSDDKCCPVCGLLINSKRFNFKQHLKIHTGEKPFTCNICNRSFRQKAHMVKHVTTHRSMPNGGSSLALEAN